MSLLHAARRHSRSASGTLVQVPGLVQAWMGPASYTVLFNGSANRPTDNGTSFNVKTLLQIDGQNVVDGAPTLLFTGPTNQTVGGLNAHSTVGVSVPGSHTVSLVVLCYPDYLDATGDAGTYETSVTGMLQVLVVPM